MGDLSFIESTKNARTSDGGREQCVACDSLFGQELATDRSQARDSLLRLLEPLVTGDHRALTVVFDGRGGRSSLSKHASMKNYTVIHSSSSQGADGVIERMLMASKSPERIVVATNDGLIRNCAYECGASAMRIEDLVSQLDQTIEQSAKQG